MVRSTNKIVNEAKDIVEKLRKDKLLIGEAFDEPIEYLYFDLWHYGGRTAKHGAYMGGADFVQWHGYYEIVSKLAELKKSAAELRREAKPAAAKAASVHQKAGGRASMHVCSAVTSGGPARDSGSSGSWSPILHFWPSTSRWHTPSTPSSTGRNGSRSSSRSRPHSCFCWPSRWAGLNRPCHVGKGPRPSAGGKHWPGGSAWRSAGDRSSVGIAGLIWHLARRLFSGADHQEPGLHRALSPRRWLTPVWGSCSYSIAWSMPASLEWSRWVILLAAGGFLGNFVLSLADHARTASSTPRNGSA